MTISEFLNNSWTIGVGSSLGTLALLFLIQIIVKSLQSLFGEFSGQYLAITGDPLSGTALIEFVECKHIRESLTGTVKGVSNLHLDLSTGIISMVKNAGKYRFNGFVDHRLFNISYRTILPGVESGGSIAMKCDSSGKTFTGIWAGLEEGTIQNAACTWVRINPTISPKNYSSSCISLAQKYFQTLYTESNPRLAKGIYAHRLISKSL